MQHARSLHETSLTRYLHINEHLTPFKDVDILVTGSYIIES